MLDILKSFPELHLEAVTVQMCLRAVFVHFRQYAKTILDKYFLQDFKKFLVVIL